MKAIVPRRWEPRDYQKPLIRYLEGGGLRADVVAVQTHAAEHALQDQLTKAARAAR